VEFLKSKSSPDIDANGILFSMSLLLTRQPERVTRQSIPMTRVVSPRKISNACFLMLKRFEDEAVAVRILQERTLKVYNLRNSPRREACWKVDV
jgi:hypothetical protein